LADIVLITPYWYEGEDQKLAVSTFISAFLQGNRFTPTRRNPLEMGEMELLAQIRPGA
jgi:hypothetical protein